MNKVNVPQLRFPGFDGEWEKTKLGNVCAKIQDGNYGGEYPKADEFVESGIPFLTSKALGGDGFLKEDKIDFIPLEKHIKLKKAQLKLNDVLFTNRGSNVGSIGFTNIKIAHGNIGPQLTLLRSDLKIIHPLFLFQIMKSKTIVKQIRSQDSGSAMNFFGISTTSKFKLSFPTLPEQQKIASFLSAVDEKIQQLSRKNELLEQYKKGVMQQLFSGKLRFKHENGNDYPDWEEKKLGEIAEKRIVKNKDNKINLVFTNSAVQGIVNQRDFFDKDIANQNNLLGYYIIEKNDFVYNPRISRTAPVGPISRNHLDVGIMSPLYSVFRFKNGNLDFFEFFFNSIVWHKHMKDISNYGARDDRMSFSTVDFYKMPIPFPCLEEQKKIANFLSNIDVKIENTNQEIKQMQHLKKGLLQQLFV